MDSADEDGGLMNERSLVLSGGREVWGERGGPVLQRCEGLKGVRVVEMSLTRRLGQLIGVTFVHWKKK